MGVNEKLKEVDSKLSLLRDSLLKIHSELVILKEALIVRKKGSGESEEKESN